MAWTGTKVKQMVVKPASSLASASREARPIASAYCKEAQRFCELNTMLQAWKKYLGEKYELIQPSISKLRLLFSSVWGLHQSFELNFQQVSDSFFLMVYDESCVTIQMMTIHKLNNK
jgi:hypothetical protein